MWGDLTMSVSDLLQSFQLLLDGSEPGLQQVLESGHASCRPGCSHCCYQITPVLWLEALNMARAVRELPADRQCQIEAACREQIRLLERITTNPHTRWQKLMVACPLLENGHCSVYGARPMACRGHAVSSDPADCDLSQLSTVKLVPGTLIPLIPPTMFAYQQTSVPGYEAPIAIMLHFAFMPRDGFKKARGHEVLARASKKWRKHGASESDELAASIAGQYAGIEFSV